MVLMYFFVAPAHSLNIETAKSTEAANALGIFRVTILDKDGEIIRTGIDSALIVRVEIASLIGLKMFSVDPPHEDMLAITKVR